MINQKEARIEKILNKTNERNESTTIEINQKLPPYLPTKENKRNIVRPKSNLSNNLPTRLADKPASKLRISLRGSLNSDEKPKLRTKSAFGIFDSISRATLSDKTRSILLGKRVVSKESRKKSKSRLSLGDKKNLFSSKYKCRNSNINSRGSTSKIPKYFQEDNSISKMTVSANFSTKKESNKIKHLSSSVSRNSKIVKKRKDNLLKYNINNNLFTSANINFDSFPLSTKNMRYEHLTKFDGSTTKISIDRGSPKLKFSKHKASYASSDTTPLTTSKAEERKGILVSSKIKHSKKTKNKNFKLSSVKEYRLFGNK